MEASASQEVPASVVEALQQQLTAAMVERLMAYAVDKTRRKWWQGVRNGPMPGGLLPGDLVQEAVLRVLKNKRQWDPTIHPDLFGYLCSVIDSLLYHLAKGEANRILRSETALDKEGSGGQEHRERVFDRMPGNRVLEADAQVLEKEADQFFWGFHATLSDDPLLQGMVECVVDGLGRAEMAAGLGVPAKEIDNGRKRLQRRLEAFRSSWHSR